MTTTTTTENSATLFSPLSTISEAIEDMKQGKMVILVDDEDRENEGDIIIAADAVTPETVNFMAKHARGLICLSLDSTIVERLGLPMMTDDNGSKFKTAFTNSIEATTGVTTGISAQDRAHTIKVAVDPNSTPGDIVMPGHVFPLRAANGGVLIRQGQTEGSVDLARLAGHSPAAVICEIMNEDGTMSRLDDLALFAKEHGIKIVSINDLIAYRMKSECFIEELSSAKLPTVHGEFQMKVFGSPYDSQQHIALVRGDIDPDNCLVRVHSECFTGDALGSTRCDCGWQLQSAMKRISGEGGVLLYMQQEGRGIGLANKIKAYALQDDGMDTVEANHALGFKADHRDYGIGSQILRQLGIKKMRLLTNNPRKIVGIEGFGLEIAGREPIEMPATKDNLCYLQTKQEKLGHLLTLDNVQS